jgi:hypothetical protein
MTEPLQRVDLKEGWVMAAYRVVMSPDRDDPQFAESFLTNHAKNYGPRGREIEIPDVWDSLSVFLSLQGAQQMRAPIAAAVARRGGRVRMGDHVAELRLEGGTGVEYEDLKEPTGHISIWAPVSQLVSCVVDIHPA